MPLRGVVDEQQQQQQQQQAKGQGQADDEDEARDPPATAVLAASCAGGRLVAGQDGKDAQIAVEEPMSVLLGTVLGQVRFDLNLTYSNTCQAG